MAPNLARACKNAAADADPSTSRTYRWTQFEGREQVTEFDESHFQLEGRFESNSSAGHKEYQARIRAIHLRKQGRSKADIAKILDRSERYVSKWWQKDEREVPKPWGVHGFLGGEMGFEAVLSGATMNEDTATDAATWWRDVEIRRGFAKDPAIYTEIMENADWESLPSNTKDFSTGAPVMKYMKDGTVCTQSYQKAKYSPGLSAATDKVLQKLFAEFGIEGRTVGVLLNRYDDGQAMLGSHRHDCWTALFSFGSERILTIDHTPLLCQDGDLVIFGTQRHGVPKMPDISTGRITVVVFFYPNNLQKQMMWQTIADDDNPSRAMVAIQHDTFLGQSAEDWALWGFGGRGHAALEQIKRLGFDSENDIAEAKKLLRASDFDGARAAAALLRRRSPRSRQLMSDALATAGSSCGGGRWAKRREADFGREALRLSASPDQELLCECLPSGARPKFSAEDWDGVSGDLIAHFLRGGNVRMEELDQLIKLDEMDPVKLLSMGTGSHSERSFFDVLSSQGVRTLYDLRASESVRDMRASSALPHFTTKNLRVACKARGMLYKSMALGRDSAYGILAHLRSPEGQHMLMELVWQAQRHCTAFLGSEEDWRHDARLAIAEELTKAGHSVEHIEHHASMLTKHELGGRYPDWMVQEAERLRKLEQMRHSGALQHKAKSSVDRSTESVARGLMTQPDEVDAMGVLREAANQQELKFAQRRLATMQRYAQKQELPKKVLAGVPQFLATEARLQEAWVAEKKAGTEKDMNAQEAMPEDIEDLQVECRICSLFFAWSALKAGDGCCTACAESQATSSQASTAIPQDSGADLLVECSSCGVEVFWSKLAEADGICASCATRSQASGSQTEGPEEDAAPRWVRHTRSTS